MIGSEDSITLDSGARTTLRQLASEGRVTVWHSGSYSPDSTSEAQQAWWADFSAGRSYEISKATYEFLKTLGAPDLPLS